MLEGHSRANVNLPVNVWELFSVKQEINVLQLKKNEGNGCWGVGAKAYDGLISTVSVSMGQCGMEPLQITGGGSL